MPIRITLLALITMFSLCTRAIAAPSMSDGEAKSLTENSLKQEAGQTWDAAVPLGTFTVVKQGAESIQDGGTIRLEFYESILGFEKIGVVTVTKDQKYENYKKGNEFSWNQWNQQTQQGVTAKITVKPTELGWTYPNCGYNGNNTWLVFPPGEFSVTSIAKNEERKKGVDDYRLVMVAFSVDWNPLVSRHQEVMGRPHSKNRKAIVLFKWDPFTSKWVYVASDQANANEEFKTNYVTNTLGH